MKQARTHAMFSLTILLACCACAFALDASLDVSQYAHTSWKVRDGFAKGPINCIAQTPDGYLWLGTEFGLYRFDGARATPWEPPAGQQLPSSDIRALLVSRDGTLWIGTTGGLARWKDGKFTVYDEVGETVFSLLESRDTAIWVGTYGASRPGRLCEIRSADVRCHGEDGTLGSLIIDLFEDAKGNLWAGVANGLWRWQPGPSEFISVSGEPDGVRFGGEDERGLLIVGHNGLRRLIGGRVEPYPLAGAAPRFSIPRMLNDRDGALWLGTLDRGLLHLHQGKTDTFSHADGLSADDATGFFEDREGSIWVATVDGLDRFRPYVVPTVSVKQGLSTALAWTVLAAKDGSVLIATAKGLNKWEHGQIFSLGQLNGYAPNSVFQDSGGRIWASTSHDFGYLEEKRFVAIRNLPTGAVPSIAETPSGHLWVSYQQGGLSHLFDGKLIQQIPWAGMGREGYASSLAADHSQNGLWLGFQDGGVAYFAGGGIQKTYSAADGLGKGWVGGLRFGSRGVLWAATEGGLSRITDGRIATLTSKNGLPCDSVHWSMEDDDHSVWLYMPCGLVRIAQSELEAWIADPTKVINTTVFDSSDGVSSNSTAGGYKPQVTKSFDGKIWFATLDGASVIDPHHIPFNKIPPPVHIEQITADDKTYDLSNGLRMPPHVHDLSIDYTALSLVVPEKVRFRVKLEGQDKDWRELVNDRHVHYTNLPPKRYRFRVIACNNSGVWNQEGATVEFVIPPAWYQTNWFRGLCVAALLGLLWAAYRFRVVQLQREERKLRETIETIPTMAWVTRPDGRNQFVNRRWLEYTGLSETGAEGDSWKRLIHPEDVDRYVRRFLAVLARGETFEEEVRVRGVNGEYRWFLSRAVPLRDKRGKILRWYGVSSDIEDRKRAEQLQIDLAHTNRITMLGELAASISHELKQPITATILSADTCISWLKREKPDLEEACETANSIRKAGMRASEIIDRLRALYKKTSPKRELVDVNEIISEMVLMLRGEANRFAVSIRTDLVADLPEITADRVQVQQVLMNLMLNGIEAMNETGGVLTIKSEPQDGHVHISVSDTGVGLPADKTNKIFDAFYTTKPQGSGMGLAISRSIVESHGGRLWATPNDGRGASFHFSLPTATAAAEAPARVG